MPTGDAIHFLAGKRFTKINRLIDQIVQAELGFMSMHEHILYISICHTEILSISSRQIY